MDLSAEQFVRGARCLLSDSDRVLFPIVQCALAGFAIACFFFDRFHRWRAGGRGVAMTVTRGPTSMVLFYGAYVAFTGIFVSLALQVDLAKNHRVFFVVLDSLLIFYLCLLNFWFRNKLVGWANRLASIESR